jgi:Tol biopolymer transport system component
VFQRQEHANKLDLGVSRLLGPERGLWSDVWLIRADGKSYWQLTHAVDMGSTVLEPHISFEGDRMLWSERTRSRTGAWAWQPRTATVVLNRGVPKLKKLERHPADELEGLVISHGFLPDDRRMLLSAERPGKSRSLDLGVLDPATGSIEWLTRSQAGGEGYAALSPRAPLIAFASSSARGPGPAYPEGKAGEALPAGEVWLMEIDGSDKRALTRFNDASSAESLGRAWVGDLAWSPDGGRLAVQVVSGIAEGRPAIVLLEVESTSAP